MTFEIFVVIALLASAMILFSTEWLPVDVVTLGLVAALILSGVITPAEAFRGFGSEVIVILASIMVLAGAIVKAGVMDWLGRLAHGLGGGLKHLSLLILLAITAVTSGFLSNTTTTAIMMPAALDTARRARISASRVLMPLAYASILGGSCTLIGTSTNLAASGMVAQLGLEPFSLFEFLGIGAIITVAGAAWMVLFGQGLIPDRRPADLETQTEPRRFFTTLCFPEDSPAIGKQIGRLDLDKLEVDVLAVVREGQRLSANPARKLKEGDKLIIRASRNGLLNVKKSGSYTLEPDAHFSERYSEGAEFVLAEALISPQSRLVGQTLKQLDFVERFRSIVLAVYRHDQSRAALIENLQLRAGDMLLLQAPEEDLRRMRGSTDLRVLMEIDETVVTSRQGFLTLGAMAAAVAASALGLVPFSVAVLAAVLAVVIAGGITMEEAYRFIEWRLLILIGGMTSFGLAMETSGAASFLAEHIVALSAPFGPVLAMAAFSLIAVVLTQPMSNAAAALTILPVAVASAGGLGVDARMLAVLVTLSASLSFITPLEPACLLVYGPGRYKFMDYVKAGTPLTIISVALLLVFVPQFWP